MPRFSCVLFALCGTLLASTSVFAGSENHGGDGVVITFQKARALAGDMIASYRLAQTDDPLADDALRNWIKDNGDALTKDVAESPHKLTEQALAHDALTTLHMGATIQLSVPVLREARYSTAQAAALLIHESAHHLGVADEAFANYVAARISDRWERRFLRETATLSSMALLAPPVPHLTMLCHHTTVMMGDKLFIWGGSFCAGPLWDTTGLIYSPGDGRWTQASRTGQPYPREDAAGVWTGKEVLLWGGGSAWDQKPVDGAAYNPTTDTWRAIASGGPAARRRHKAVWTGSEMIVWSGDAYELWKVGFRYDPATDKWRPMAPIGEVDKVGVHHSAAWSGETGHPETKRRLLVVEPERGAPTMHLYDPTTDSWSVIAATESSGGYHFTDIVWTGRYLLVLYETNYGQAQRAVVFDVKEARWRLLRYSALAPTQTAKLAPLGEDRVIAFGAAAHVLDIPRERWSAYELEALGLEARQSAARVWTGESLISIGGFRSPGLKSFGDALEVEP